MGEGAARGRGRQWRRGGGEAKAESCRRVERAKGASPEAERGRKKEAEGGEEREERVERGERGGREERERKGWGAEGKKRFLRLSVTEVVWVRPRL